MRKLFLLLLALLLIFMMSLCPTALTAEYELPMEATITTIATATAPEVPDIIYEEALCDFDVTSTAKEALIMTSGKSVSGHHLRSQTLNSEHEFSGEYRDRFRGTRVQANKIGY